MDSYSSLLRNYIFTCLMQFLLNFFTKFNEQSLLHHFLFTHFGCRPWHETGWLFSCCWENSHWNTCDKCMAMWKHEWGQQRIMCGISKLHAEAGMMYCKFHYHWGLWWLYYKKILFYQVLWSCQDIIYFTLCLARFWNLKTKVWSSVNLETEIMHY